MPFLTSIRAFWGQKIMCSQLIRIRKGATTTRLPWALMSHASQYSKPLPLESKLILCL